MRSARLLKHRNIVTIHDAGEVAGTLYVAMEMLEGESLRKVLDAGTLPISRAIEITRETAAGLAHAHLQGVVHGGLKPSNIIVLRSGIVKVTDFGIGLLGHEAQGYVAPEQRRGEPVDHRCDIFSLGALFYEMLTHRPPAAEPPPPSELNPHVPRALDPMVLSMLAGQPVSRMPGVPILLRELERLGEGLGLGSAASQSETEPEPKAPIPGVKRLRPREPVSDVPRSDPMPDREAFDYESAIAMMDRESRRERSSGSRRTIWAPVALVLALLGIGVAGFAYYSSWPGEASVRDTLARMAPAHRTQAAPTAALEPTRQMAPARVADATKEPPEKEPLAPVAKVTPEPAPAPAPTPMAATPVVRTSEQAEPSQALLAQKPGRAMQPTAKIAQRQPGGRIARVVLDVSPRGEIYIDGEHRGTTPPITTLDLEPGLHRIEVRSGSRTPYLTYMTVQAGDVRQIRYDFDTSRAVHPPNRASWPNSRRPAVSLR
jgi:serine/threonine-protein kinase